MAEATLSSPFTLDPRQATKLRVREFTAEKEGGFVRAVIDYVDADGNVVHTDRYRLTGAQVVTWIANQEATILTRYLAATSMVGTVA